ncbi:hypothetical protein ACFPM0_28430 [Pseudonocardia sulfidoxydans]
MEVAAVDPTVVHGACGCTHTWTNPLRRRRCLLARHVPAPL